MQKLLSGIFLLFDCKNDISSVLLEKTKSTDKLITFEK